MTPPAPLVPALQSDQDLQHKQKEIVDLERELDRFEETRKKFADAVEHALKVIAENSRLKSLFEGPIREQVKRITSIPNRGLDGRDVQAMIHFAEVLARHDSRDELEAAEALAAHLLKLTPDEYRVPDVLLKVIPILLQQEESLLLEQAKTANQRIVKNWLETDPRNFLSLYWYTELYEATDDAARRKWKLLEASRLPQLPGRRQPPAQKRKPEVQAIADSRAATGLLTQMLRALLAERAPISDFERLCDVFLKRGVKARPGPVIEEMRMLMREWLWGNSKDFRSYPLAKAWRTCCGRVSSIRGHGVCS